jgi:hypothetical protein
MNDIEFTNIEILDIIDSEEVSLAKLESEKAKNTSSLRNIPDLTGPSADDTDYYKEERERYDKRIALKKGIIDKYRAVMNTVTYGLHQRKITEPEIEKEKIEVNKIFRS